MKITCDFIRMKYTRQQITAGFLTVLFVSYFAGVSFFSHTHINEYNQLIVHSHPFSSESHHQHSTANFQVIDKLQHFFVNLLMLAVALTAIYKLCLFLSDTYQKGFHLSSFTPYCFSRPPPAN